MSPTRDVCVIGAGVSGLTTAAYLSRVGHNVTVFAEKTTPLTTSSTAAAFWYPFWMGDQPNHSWYRQEWAFFTLRELEAYSAQPLSGITHASLLEYFDSRMSSKEISNVIKSMWWQAIPSLEFRQLSARSLRDLEWVQATDSLRFSSGITFRTLVVNMSEYLAFLNGLLPREVIILKVGGGELKELQQSFEFIVNCTGLESKQLMGDQALQPREGVVVRLERDVEINDIVLLHTGETFGTVPLYIVPRGGTRPDIIVGGTTVKRYGEPRHLGWEDAANVEPRIWKEANRIREWGIAWEPRLERLTPLGISVGYRPVRMRDDNPLPVRLGLGVELEGATKGLIHNYGHGGAGITLSWGCARVVADFIEWLS